MSRLTIGLVFLMACIMVSCEMVDTGPVPGGDGKVEIGVLVTGTFCRWPAATDTRTSQPDLEYMVYESDSPDIETLDECKSNGTAISGWLAGYPTQMEYSPTGAGSHFLNVIARDEDGNECIYTMSDNWIIVG